MKLPGWTRGKRRFDFSRPPGQSDWRRAYIRQKGKRLTLALPEADREAFIAELTSITAATGATISLLGRRDLEAIRAGQQPEDFLRRLEAEI